MFSRAFFVLLFISSAVAQDALPVRKVVLYKNGMGYFEHIGDTGTKSEIELVLPSSQLDDVLKSLTVIDLNRGQIGGVTYDSTAPLDRRLAELPIKMDASDSLLQFLNSIRGTEVEIRTPAGPVSGRLLGAELRKRQVGEYTVRESIEASVFTPSGELRTVELSSPASLRLVEKQLAGDVGRFLDLLDSANQRAVRRLRIQAGGEGSRKLQVSYTSEAPIWKTTYRLVLDDKRKPLLQGWAIVDNTTPNDWVNVEMALVTGAPVSFIQRLSQPLYGRRPEVPVARGVQVTPQTHESTLETSTAGTAIAGRITDAAGAMLPGASVTAYDSNGRVARLASSDTSGRYRMDLAPGRYRIEASAPGFATRSFSDVAANPGRTQAVDFMLQVGAVSEMIAVERSPKLPSEPRALSAPSVLGGIGSGTAGGAGGGSGGGFGGGVYRAGGVAAPAPPPPPADMLRQFEAGAMAQVAGEQFEYKLSQPVTVRRNQSALLPIANAEVDGEKVTVYNEATGASPRHAVWLKNTSGLTLDAGSFTVLDANTFAGEGLTEVIHPDERRLLSYGLDLSTNVTTNRSTGEERLQSVVLAKGVARLSRLIQEKRVYVIRNNEQRPKNVVIEHPVRHGWTLAEGMRPLESSAGAHRFRVEVPAKNTVELAVQEENPQVEVVNIRDIGSGRLDLWVQQRTLTPEMETALRAVLAKRAVVQALNEKLQALQDEEEQIVEDQTRLRENLSKLTASREEQSLRLRYVKELEAQEDRIAEIRAEWNKLQEQRKAADDLYSKEIEKITLEQTRLR